MDRRETLIALSSRNGAAATLGCQSAPLSQSRVASRPLAFIFFECTLTSKGSLLLKCLKSQLVSRDIALPILAWPHVLVSSFRISERTHELASQVSRK